MRQTGQKPTEFLPFFASLYIGGKNSPEKRFRRVGLGSQTFLFKQNGVIATSGIDDLRKQLIFHGGSFRVVDHIRENKHQRRR